MMWLRLILAYIAGILILSLSIHLYELPYEVGTSLMLCKLKRALGVILLPGAFLTAALICLVLNLLLLTYSEFLLVYNVLLMGRGFLRSRAANCYIKYSISSLLRYKFLLPIILSLFSSNISLKRQLNGI